MTKPPDEAHGWAENPGSDPPELAVANTVAHGRNEEEADMQDEFQRVIALFQALTERIGETVFEAECAVADIEEAAREEEDEARRTELERRAEVLEELKDLLADAAGEVDHQIDSQPADELEAVEA